MRVGLNVDENFKTLFEEISSFEYLDLQCENANLESVDIVVIDSRKEDIDRYLKEYKKRNLSVIALVGEEDIYEMRKLFLSGLVDDCIVRRDIFKIEESIERFLLRERSYDTFYLSDTFKKGIYSFSEINYITYSSVTRKSEFHLINSEVFDIKRSFSEIEERLKSIDSFYKLDRSTIINLNLVQVLDFKEEQIIFKNREFIYISKGKLKELENIYLVNRDRDFLRF